MWGEPEQKLIAIPASQANYQHFIALVAQPGHAYRVSVRMESGSASGIEVQLYNSEKQTSSHRRHAKKGESIELVFAVPFNAEELKLCVYPERIGKTAGHSATARVAIQAAPIDECLPKVTFGIDTGIGIAKVKGFIENILRQDMKNCEVLIYRNSTYADSRHGEDSLYADMDSRIRFIEDSPQESWIDVVIREAREEYLILFDNTVETLPALDIEEWALTALVPPDLLLLNESSNVTLGGLTAMDGDIYEVADRFQLIKTLQAEKAHPVLMRTSFVQAWLSNELLPTPSAYSVVFCAAALAKTIACLPVQSWSACDNYVLPEASLVADELAWLNSQLESCSSSERISLLLGYLKHYASRLAAILGETIDAKAESRFLELTGSYTSLLRVTTTSHESFIKACHTVTRMIENTFNNALETHRQ